MPEIKRAALVVQNLCGAAAAACRSRPRLLCALSSPPAFRARRRAPRRRAPPFCPRRVADEQNIGALAPEQLRERRDLRFALVSSRKAAAHLVRAERISDRLEQRQFRRVLRRADRVAAPIRDGDFVQQQMLRREVTRKLLRRAILQRLLHVGRHQAAQRFGVVVIKLNAEHWQRAHKHAAFLASEHARDRSAVASSQG
ncbi:MAG: hypothetical protein WKF30_04535 [Pyrinomonadaceae bacterium]